MARDLKYCKMAFIHVISGDVREIIGYMPLSSVIYQAKQSPGLVSDQALGSWCPKS